MRVRRLAVSPPSRLLGACLAVSLLAACADEGNGPDRRCFDVAQVPAWTVAWTVAFSDTGTAQDSFRVRLHHDVSGTGVTGPAFATSEFEGRAWFTLSPTGTIAINDTVINVNVGDTTAGVATAFSPHPVGAGAFSGGYVSVDLETCTASIGALYFAPMTMTIDGSGTGIDTIQVGYPLVRALTVDSMAVADGWVFPPTKVATRAGAYDFLYDQQYLPLSLGGRYAPGVLVDSASIGFTVTPATP
jgi:hypothetical protein